jgi:ATP-dependent helicase/nuclease subunit A
VLIADYKTNRHKGVHARLHGLSPGRIDEVPKAYVIQLALYRAVLGRLYPDKTIRCALIWTEVPDLMEISAASLDAALLALTSP